MFPPLNRVNDVLQMLALGRTKLYRLISEGQLEAVKSGGQTRITGKSLQKFLKSLPPADIKPPSLPPSKRNAAGRREARP